MAVTLLMAGCQAKQNPPAASQPLGDQSSPEAVARGVLSALREERQAIAAGDRKAAELAVRRAADLAAREKIEDEARRFPNADTLFGADPALAYAKLWGALLAYYLNDIDLNNLTTRGGGRSATVVAKAGDVAIDITCARLSEERWAVLRIEFAAATVAQTALSIPLVKHADADAEQKDSEPAQSQPEAD